PLPEVMPRSHEKKSEKKTSVTLVPALPPTSYKDEADTYQDRDTSKGKANTLAYIRVQRHILKYLKTRAADAVDRQQVTAWTKAIDPTDAREPTAEEALRLCYYMRSQGFDVYAKFESKKLLCLYLVDQTTTVRSVDHDFLYWAQNFCTNEID
ncbi:hypothetical protein GQ44DRAFT_552846, partial [Phaeosphaeriaceae sp. PMI808]